MSKEEQGPQGFKVSDRRGFTADGERREKTGPDTEAAPGQATPPRPGAAAGGEAPGDKRRQGPQIDFSSFIISLATTAMVHLGESPDPAAGKVRENLEAARQMIDILTLLEQKTQGNLDAEEARLMEEILYELRMKFVSKSKSIQL